MTAAGCIKGLIIHAAQAMTKVNTMKIVFAVVVAITLLLAVVRADHKRVKDELKDVAVIESAERALTMDLLRDEVAHVSNILRRAFLQSLSEIGRDQGKAKLKKKKGPAAKKVITKPKKNLKACKITKPKAPRKKTGIDLQLYFHALMYLINTFLAK